MLQKGHGWALKSFILYVGYGTIIRQTMLQQKELDKLTLYDMLELGGLYVMDESANPNRTLGRPVAPTYYANGEAGDGPHVYGRHIKKSCSKEHSVVINESKGLQFFSDGNVILCLADQLYKSYGELRFDGFTFSREQDFNHPGTEILVLFKEQFLTIPKSSAAWFTKIGQ